MWAAFFLFSSKKCEIIEFADELRPINECLPTSIELGYFIDIQTTHTHTKKKVFQKKRTQEEKKPIECGVLNAKKHKIILVNIYLLFL